jgi:hypothetical protein
MAKQTPVQPVSAPSTEPAGEPAPVADAQKKAMEEIVALFDKLPLPILATGAPHAAYAQDLLPLGKVQARKIGTEKWLTLFSEDKKEPVAGIPSSQLRAMLFTALSFLQAPRTDRGFAYCQWAAANKDTVEKYLGAYELKVSTPKGTLPIMIASIKDLLAGVAVRAKILSDSVKLQAPVKTAGTKHSSTKEEYTMVL